MRLYQYGTKLNKLMNWIEKYCVSPYHWRPSFATYFAKYWLYIACEWEFVSWRFITLWLLTIHDKASNSDNCEFRIRLPRWCFLNIFWLKWLKLADTVTRKRIAEIIFILIVCRNMDVEMNSWTDAFIPNSYFKLGNKTPIAVRWFGHSGAAPCRVR